MMPLPRAALTIQDAGSLTGSGVGKKLRTPKNVHSVSEKSKAKMPGKAG
ncbi:hypothetical protein [Nitrobacter sp.]